MVIVGTTIGVTLLHFERAYDVDLEQAVQAAILGDLHELGVVSRDKFGRFVNGQGATIWP